MKNRLVITVDGPAGAGKSTVSRILAKKLSYIYLDTGALYRAIAYQADREGLADAEESRLRELCEKTRIEFRPGKSIRVIVNDVDVTDEIRAPEIGLLASSLSARAVVRKSLLFKQREIAGKGGVVAEGRDMGTVVFPWADVKFYLDASVEERAKRRCRELIGKGYAAIYDEVVQEISRRDRQDREREIAPLRPAEDAIIIDSTTEGIQEIVNKMMDLIKKSRPTL